MSHNAAANNGMHPTADTAAFIFGYLAGRRVMPGVRLLPMMKALSIQIQPERAPDLKMDEVQAAFEAITEMPSLVRHHQFDDGFDKTRYFNFTFGTEDLKGLWAVIQSTVYSNPALAEPLATSSIVVCTGENGWDDYHLLFHFDPSEPRADINAI